MSTSNRAALSHKAHKVLKKYYKPVEPIERPVLEHLLYACLLENTHYEQADKAFDLLKASLFDWNEVRVSTVKELAEMVPFSADAMTASAISAKCCSPCSSRSTPTTWSHSRS